jgi:hypothetical protein
VFGLIDNMTPVVEVVLRFDALQGREHCQGGLMLIRHRHLETVLVDVAVVVLLHFRARARTGECQMNHGAIAAPGIPTGRIMEGIEAWPISR